MSAAGIRDVARGRAMQPPALLTFLIEAAVEPQWCVDWPRRRHAGVTANSGNVHVRRSH